LKNFFENHRDSGAAGFFYKSSCRCSLFLMKQQCGSFFSLTLRRASGGFSAAIDISVHMV
jgi:hypothetical protein